MFRVSDLPGLSQTIVRSARDGGKGVGVDKLCDWFSTARMSRYAVAANPGALYVWDDRLSKAYLEDVAHVEMMQEIGD